MNTNDSHIANEYPGALALRPDEVAKAVRISLSQVYKLIDAGEIPSATIGGRKRVPLDRLLLWIDKNTTHGGATVDPRVVVRDHATGVLTRETVAGRARAA